MFQFLNLIKFNLTSLNQPGKSNIASAN